jgi:Fe(3+) dicitrate transport protein
MSSNSRFASASLMLLTLAAGAARAQPAPPTADPSKPHPVAGVQVAKHAEDTRAKLEFIMREVDGAKVTVGKKSSITLLAEQPTIADENPRDLFVRTPGLLVVLPADPTRIDLSYRGLTDARGSQGLMVLQDGVPLSPDALGAPSLNVLPMTQGIAQVQLIRAGSSLIYGPEPGPAINLVSRRPTPGEAATGYSEQVGGSDGLYSSWNVVEGTDGAAEYRVDLGHVQSDGQRANADSQVWQGDAYFGWRPAKGRLVYLDLHAYDAQAGRPGGLSLAQDNADPSVASTPDDRSWASRYAAILGTELDLAQGWRVEGKLWTAYQDLSERAADATGAHPASLTLQDALYRSAGAEIRLKKAWGRGNAFTFGADLWGDDAPLRQWSTSDANATPDQRDGAAAVLRQARKSYYGSIFAETVFRLPDRIHLIPSVRLDHEELDVGETLKPAALARPLADVHRERDTPLFGLGLGNDFGKDNETYFSVSQGYRPLRFLDVASPVASQQPGLTTDPSRSLSWEAGVHGTPLKGLFYDASLFWISLSHRIETLPVNAANVVEQDMGDTVSRGFEGEIAYDLLAGRPDRQHLQLFANVALLDARFVKSALPGQVGRTPADAPHALVQAGATWRRDQRYSLSLTAVSVGATYFQDSDQPLAGPVIVPAKTPAYTVFDLSGDWRLTRRVRVLGGISNLADERYYARVLGTGIEPAPGRTFYAGLALGF